MPCEAPLGCVVLSPRMQHEACVTYSNQNQAMASMNKGMNLPAIQRIMMEFEKQSSMMDMKEEMMADAVDDVMEDDEEDEEAEGDKILQAVLEEVGIDLQQKVRITLTSSGLRADILTQLGEAPTSIHSAASPIANKRQAVAVGGDDTAAAGDGGVSVADEEALQARLDKLRGP